MKTGLIVLDIQKYFDRENPDVFEMKLIPGMERALEIFRKKQLPVFI